MKSKRRIIVVIIFLIISLFATSELCTGSEITPEDYTDPPNDLIFIYTGYPVPQEEYAGYLDVTNSTVEVTPESIDFRITLNDGIPSLTYTTFWTLMIDRNNDAEDNCPDYPTENVDTMYSITYISTTKEWMVERAVYQPWGWDTLPTEATWGIVSSWPEGKPQMTISIPLLEMPELLPETLPWKIKTECTGTYKGDLAPDTGRYYTPLFFSEFMFIEGVFQPVQVVYQHDPIWGDNMTMINSHEWIANIPMVQDKNTLLFGYPYDDRNTIRFSVTNLYSTAKTFTLRFWVENRIIYETEQFTLAASNTIRINLTAPLPRNNTSNSPEPFQFKSKGNSRIEVEVHPAPTSEPLSCNRVIVHTKVQYTTSLDILYVPFLLINGTTEERLHDPVTLAEAEEHAGKATTFLKGTYPVAEDAITYTVAWPPFPINHTQVRATGPDFTNPPWNIKVNMAKLLLKLTQYAYREGYPSYTRLVALVPDTNWVRTYGYSENATHIWHSSWAGLMFPSNKQAVFVVKDYWTATAHEIGHTFGLWVDYPENDEEYNKADPGFQAPGYWINRKMDMLPTNTFCFMGTAPPRDLDTRWIDKKCYQWLLKKFTRDDPEILLVNGLLWKNGTVELTNWYRLRSGVTDIPLGTSGNLNFLFLDSAGTIIGRAGLDIFFTVKTNEPQEVDVVNFAFKIHFVEGTFKIQMTYKGLVVAEREVTENTPVVTVTFPNGGEILNPRTPVTVTWNASDTDGDALTYIIEYSNNSGLTWTPITVDAHTLSYTWDIRELSPGKSYMVKVVATDGLNVGENTSDKAFSITFREDINNDGKVNIVDIFTVAEAFGSSTEDPRWNPEADIDGDGKVNIVDISTIARKFGKSL